MINQIVKHYINEKMPLKYHPEFAEHFPSDSGANSSPIPAHDIPTRRQWASAICSQFAASALPPDIEHVVYRIPSDNVLIEIHHYRKKPVGKTPGIVHFHGGGFFSLSVESVQTMLVDYVRDTGVQFLSVEYRLAPEHPFPIPMEDSWTGLKWVYSHAEELNIDQTRIGVMGESAGGGLAASMALRARTENLSPPLARQILIYPMLDDRTVNRHVGDLASWTEADNVTGWTAYLGDKVGSDSVSAYAAPARAVSLAGLPPLYMDVGQLDIFVHEGVEYVRRLVDVGVSVDFHLYSGLPHGFEGLAPRSPVAKRAWESRVRAIRELYY
ncbi:Alpha/Beta hydrolase protein [Aspergillus avenaceus]|uniref:Alpha/Beta hydrolase protein n=1 Tax=Aspergillus avenaceus TaxID=36643 RepID=A0A5N6U3X2_ASPAV|nr:Alpha/Beta hydrolase protein [Aspergillus avenaceus]